MKEGVKMGHKRGLFRLGGAMPRTSFVMDSPDGRRLIKRSPDGKWRPSDLDEFWYLFDRVVRCNIDISGLDREEQKQINESVDTFSCSLIAKGLGLSGKLLSIMMFVFCVSCVSDTKGCKEYPCGPYEFKQGSVVPRMTWPYAIPLNFELEDIPLDLSKVYQDESVNSVFVLVVSSLCFSCPRMMQNIQGSSDTWEEYGVLR